jgi:hypothetical protein
VVVRKRALSTATNCSRHLFRVNRDGRRWRYRSPAMAADITDHIWSVKELLSIVPVPLNT